MSTGLRVLTIAASCAFGIANAAFWAVLGADPDRAFESFIWMHAVILVLIASTAYLLWRLKSTWAQCLECMLALWRPILLVGIPVVLSVAMITQIRLGPDPISSERPKYGSFSVFERDGGYWYSVDDQTPQPLSRSEYQHQVRRIAGTLVTGWIVATAIVLIQCLYIHRRRCTASAEPREIASE